MSSFGGHHFVFVGGVPRSGTSFFTRCLGDHPAVSVFRDTPAPEDEGQHLTDAVPSGIGDVGDFALRDGTELRREDASPARTERLWRDWSPYWDPSKPVLVEKSPANIIRMSFLDASFPGATFVVLVRHPVPTVVAQDKMSSASEWTRLRNWARCHRIMARHAPNVDLIVVPYHRFVAEPDREMARVHARLGLRTMPVQGEVHPGLDRMYWDVWWSGRDGRRELVRRFAMSVVLERRVRDFGFSLFDPGHFDRSWCRRQESG